MKHKTWFRLVVKLVGLYALVTAIPGFVRMFSNIMTAVFTYAQARGQWRYDWQSQVPWLLEQAAQIGVGVYLLIWGKWLVDKCIPPDRLYCATCGYDLSASRGPQCPECGSPIPQQLAGHEAQP